MLLANCLCTSLFLAVFTGLWDSAHGLNISPVITSTNHSDVVVNPGENYTITCEGGTSINWNYPNHSDSQPHIQETEISGKYVSALQLTNITYKNVGFYTCLLNNNSEKNSSIYLFVKDNNNLLTSDGFAPLHGLQHQDVIIPCKPTHPDVNVTLCLNGFQKLNIGENADVGVIRYNQKLGFVLENAQLRNNGYYGCCVLPGGICGPDGELCAIYSLDVLVRTTSVPRPVIEDADLRHVKVGQNVTIECRVVVPMTIRCSLDWIIPHKSDRVTIEDVLVDSPAIGRHLSSGRRKLKIFNAKLEDTGNYTCKVRDHAGNSNSEVVYLQVFDN